jgi:hypothetical protein
MSTALRPIPTVIASGSSTLTEQKDRKEGGIPQIRVIMGLNGVYNFRLFTGFKAVTPDLEIYIFFNILVLLPCLGPFFRCSLNGMTTELTLVPQCRNL